MKCFTFHTGGQYEAAAAVLKATAGNVGLECIVIERPDLGSWWKNCNQKCDVVAEMLDRFGEEPIVWNDCDTHYLSYPKLFDTITDDLALYYMSPTRPMGGVMFFNGRSKAMRYVEAWRANVLANPEYDDDAFNLRKAVCELPQRHIYHLPPAYLWNEKNMRSGFPGTVPVIEHFYNGLHDYPTRAGM